MTIGRHLLKRPYQDRKSVILTGLGKSRMASRYFGKGCTESEEIQKPAKSTLR